MVIMKMSECNFGYFVLCEPLMETNTKITTPQNVLSGVCKNNTQQLVASAVNLIFK